MNIKTRLAKLESRLSRHDTLTTGLHQFYGYANTKEEIIQFYELSPDDVELARTFKPSCKVKTLAEYYETMGREQGIEQLAQLFRSGAR